MSDKKLAESTLPSDAHDLVTYRTGALADMQREVIEHMGKLNVRQRDFVRFFAAGQTVIEAARMAGYTGKNVGSQMRELMEKNESVGTLLSLLREMDGLKYGFPAQWKRAELLDLYGAARDAEQLSVANNVLRSLMEMDGDIRQKDIGGSSSVTIKVVTGIEGILHEAQTVEAEIIEGSADVINGGE